jgi:hypothetical protein
MCRINIVTFIFVFGVDKRAVRNPDLTAGKVTVYCGLDRDGPSKMRELRVHPGRLRAINEQV